MNQLRLVGPFALVSVAALAAATVAGFVLVSSETMMPVHWGPDGAADGFLPRNQALLMPPAILAVLWLIFAVVLKRGGEVDRARQGLRAAFAGIGMLMAAIQIATIAIALGYPVDMVRVIAFCIGLMFIGLGNVMPKSQPNSYAGFRLRWTLESPANWVATNRFAGALMMLGGIILAVAALLVAQPLWLLAVIVLCTAAPSLAGIVYSYRFAQREKAARPL